MYFHFLKMTQLNAIYLFVVGNYIYLGLFIFQPMLDFFGREIVRPKDTGISLRIKFFYSTKKRQHSFDILKSFFCPTLVRV